MSSNREKLLSYIPLANFIAEMNGPRSEALIHDISDFEHSIIYITPQNITGRKLCGSLTDFGIQLVNSKTYEQVDYVVNYVGRSSPNNLILRSSTYFIKSEGELIGLLCINTDITDQIAAIETLRQALLVDLPHPEASQPTETFSLSADELINKIFLRTAGKLSGKHLKLADKHRIVAELNTAGIFLLKGTIQTVATLLDVSEQTLYRYINHIKTN